MKIFCLAIVLLGSIMLFSCTEKTVEIRYDQFWEPLTYSFGTTINSLLITKSNYILAGTTDKGVLISKDKWKTWNKATGIADTSIEELKQLDDGKIVAWTEKKFYSSSDEGQSWNEIIIQTPEIFNPYNTNLTLSSNGYWLFVGKNSVDARKIYLSTNDGNTWENVKIPIDRINYCKIEANDNLVVLNIFTNDSSFIYIKKKNESEFKMRFKLYLGNNSALNCRLLSNNIIASDDYKLYKSIDMGDNWKEIINGIIEGFFNVPILTFSYNKKILLFTSNSNLYYSTNYGDNWIYIDTGQYYGYYACMYITSDNFLIGRLGWSFVRSRKPIL